MKKLVISVLCLLSLGWNGYAQKSQRADGFTPAGKPLVTIFSDFRYAIKDGKTNPAFEISRAYFGYSYNFSPNFSTKIVFDISSNNNGGTFPSAYSAYVKNAFGEYSNKILKIDFGMIGTNIFNTQESLWGKRYLQKSFQDLNGYGSSAGLGVGVKLQATSQLSFDAQLVNGEGYQKVQADSAVKISLGVTYEPIKHFIVRVYGDYMKKDEAQTTFNALLAYRGERLIAGGEYNYQKGNKKVKDHNLNGISLWATYKATKRVSVFGRFDHLASNTLSGAKTAWNEAKDGQLYAAGIEIFPVKGMAIAPNVQITNPKKDGEKSTTNLLVNFNFSF
jgi:hypothetical protein